MTFIFLPSFCTLKEVYGTHWTSLWKKFSWFRDSSNSNLWLCPISIQTWPATPTPSRSSKLPPREKYRVPMAHDSEYVDVILLITCGEAHVVFVLQRSHLQVKWSRRRQDLGEAVWIRWVLAKSYYYGGATKRTNTPNMIFSVTKSNCKPWWYIVANTKF